MKIWIPILCALALFAGCAKEVGFDDLERRDYLTYFEGKPFTGVAVRKYKDGQKWFEDTYKDGKKDGLLTEWYENGQKKEETTYKEGEKHGLTSWYDNGQKKWESTFKDGKNYGLWIFYNEDGTEKFRWTFKDGERVED